MTLAEATLGSSLLAVVAYGVVGILLTAFGFKVFDWITPRIDLQKELAERNNIAVAIVVAAVIIATSLVVGHSITG
jgi:putative membrane protein